MKHLFTILAVAVLVVQASCVREDVGDCGRTHTRRVRVALDVPASARPTYTRGVRAESEIKQLHVVAFDSAGKFFNTYTAAPVAGSTNLYEVNLPLGRYDLAFWANVDKSVFASLKQGASTWSEMSTFEASDPLYYDSTIPMTGFLRGTTIDQTTELTGAKAIKLTRMVARIDLKLGNEVANSSITLAGDVRLCNYNKNGVIFPDYAAGNWSDSHFTSTNLPKQQNTVYGLETSPSSGNFGTKYEYTNIYTYERNSRESDPLNNPCVVFNILNSSGGEEWFRVDFVTMKEGKKVNLDLLRNHLYEITVTKITGAGQPTAADAYNLRGVNVEATVVAWDDGGLTEMQIDGSYYLGVSRREVMLEPYGTLYYTVDIETNVPDFRMVMGSDVLTPGSADLLYNDSYIGINLVAKTEPNHYTLNVRSDRANMGFNAQSYTQIWTIEAGRMRTTIKLDRRGEEPTTYLLYLDNSNRLAVGQWGTVTPQNLLYTKFGSIVGISKNDFRDSRVLFDPLDAVYNDYGEVPFMSENVAEDERFIAKRHTNANLSNGRGDICRLVGLTAAQVRDMIAAGTLDTYDSGFRLPTPLETKMIYGDSTKFVRATVGGKKGRWFTGVKDFLPGAGMHHKAQPSSSSNEGNGGGFNQDDNYFVGWNDGTYYETTKGRYRGSHFWFELAGTHYNPNSGTYYDDTSTVRCHPTRRVEPSTAGGYRVDVWSDGRGSALASTSIATQGMGVRLNATAANGYTFRRWVVERGVIPTLNTMQNPAVFTMPAGDVAVRAEFAAAVVSDNTQNGRITFDATGRYVLTTDPTDAGLYFRFGSVAGIYSAHGKNQRLPKATDNEAFHGAVDIAWSPVTIDNWGQIPVYSQTNWDAGVKYITPESGYHSITNVKNGYGDPCRLVGLDLDKIRDTPANQLTVDDIDNRTWRLPTVGENMAFTGHPGTGQWLEYDKHLATYGGVAGAMFPTAAEGRVETFLPLIGCRVGDGSAPGYSISHNQNAEYWSSNAQKKTFENGGTTIYSGYTLWFNNTITINGSSSTSGMVGALDPSGGNVHATGVRCVRQTYAPIYSNGNPEATRPTTKNGPKAPPGVLGVGVTSGNLTMRGSKEYASDADLKAYADREFGGLASETVVMCHFLWGSLIGLNATENDTWHGAADVVWAPAQFDMQSVKSTWPEAVPFAKHPAVWPAVDRAAAGIGDACRMADKGISRKQWVTPTGGPWNGIEYAEANANFKKTTIEGVEGRRDKDRPEFFFPAAKFRNNDSTGKIESSGDPSGLYWTATTVNNKDFGRTLSWRDSANPAWAWSYGQDPRNVASSIRCVPLADNKPFYEVAIGDVIWAGRNLATTGRFEINLHKYGAYFTYNSSQAWGYEPSFPVQSPAKNDPQWESKNNPCPWPWRVPTKADFDALMAATTNKWGVIHQGDEFQETYYREFTVTATGEILLFPASAWGKSIDDKRGSFAAYWSSTPNADNSSNAWHLYFSKDDNDTRLKVNPEGYKAHSYPIRCVRDKSGPAPVRRRR